MKVPPHHFLYHPDQELVERVTLSNGERWEIEERLRFGRSDGPDGTAIYTSVVLVVRRHGERGGRWRRAGADWRDRIPEIVEEAKCDD